MILQLYKPLERPKFEYCIPARNLIFKNAHILENFRKEKQNWLHDFKLSYVETLKKFGLTNLELRRKGENLIEVFKNWQFHNFAATELSITRSPAIAEGPRDAGVPVEIW